MYILMIMEIYNHQYQFHWFLESHSILQRFYRRQRCYVILGFDIKYETD